MKAGARFFTLTFLIPLISLTLSGQDCFVLDSNSDFQKSQLCSPVDVTKWEVTFLGVNDAGTPVTIRFDWDDGNTETLNASEGPDGVFTAMATHTYTSEDDICNYNASATIIVNGEVCEASAIETTVTVWDTDDDNGGRVNASPNVYPVCFGNGATMRFRDDTRFNCVPPQEDDVVNNGTRWIQWVYGTNHLSSKFMNASVDGYTGPWPLEGPVIELPGPVTGSNQRSDFITVADNHDIGDEFEVELRYWNYCNPYPSDPPVTDRSRIRIVDYPDPTIDPVSPLCQFGNDVTLSAATGGGTWNGPGIVDGDAGIFSPSEAGSGVHIIQYDVTDGNNCSATDTVAIEVRPGPDVSILPVDPLCSYSDPIDLEATEADGSWSGTGITDVLIGLFDPEVAGIGTHTIAFTSVPDLAGCVGTDTAEITVVDIPTAGFLTPDSTWCEEENNETTADILIGGSTGTTFDLIMNVQGTVDTLNGLLAGTTEFLLDNQPGENEYQLLKVIEHHGANSCEKILNDVLKMQVNPKPALTIEALYDDLCSPVDVAFTTTAGYNLYSWNFGDGAGFETSNFRANHTYTFKFADVLVDPGDTIEVEEKSAQYLSADDDTLVFLRNDTVYNFSLYVETIDGCADSITENIPVYPQPDANFFVGPVIQDYPDSVVTIDNLTSIGIWNYEWDFGDSTFFDQKEPEEHAYATYGNYTISLRSYSEHCSDTISKLVQILPPPPRALFEPDTTGCPPLLVNFTNSSLYADTYIWDFDDGTFSSEANPTHVFFDNREHVVTMSAIGLSGTDTTEQIVSVYTPPQAIFDVFPKEARNLKQTFKFSNNTINGEYFLWDFGDGNTSPAREPSHVYGEEGTFSVTLTAWSKENCPDTIVRKDVIKIVAGEGSVDFPTAFVFDPSSRGGNWEELPPEKINTVFRPAVVNVKEFRMEIYTRWGEKIFETNDLSIGWDGYMRNDEVAIEGVYLWKAWVKYVDNTEEILAGDITLFY